jgi:K+-sensing histidine kinase KdpD
MNSETKLGATREPSPWWRYALAVVLVVLAAVIRHNVTRLGTELPMVGMSFAVFFSAYFGGIGPGLLATFFAGMIGAIILPPHWSFKIEKFSDQVRLVSFMCLGILISLLSERARRLQARAAANELALSESRYLTLIYQSSDPILVLRDGIITVINTELVYLLGPIRRQGLLGQPFLDFVHPDDQALVNVWLADVRTGLTRAPSRLRFVSLGGSVIEATLALEVFESAAGRTVQITFSEARTVLLPEPVVPAAAGAAQPAALAT